MFENNQHKNSPATIWLAISALSLLLALAAPSYGQEAKQDHATHSQEMKIPQTAKDHYELAERYQKKAAEYRQEIEMHKKMLADFSKRVARNPKDTGENPYIRKMRLHCEKYIKATTSAAQEAEEMAKFHTFRARELEGK
ncbi:MAG: hypothetical protein JNM09_00575 [Blastocatellia bacterium]|nr:hypothetical protein [Blastocatellia bacterium]